MVDGQPKWIISFRALETGSDVVCSLILCKTLCRALGHSSQGWLLFLLVITSRVRLRFQCLVGSGLQGDMVAVSVASSESVGVQLSSVLGECSQGACGQC